MAELVRMIEVLLVVIVQQDVQAIVVKVVLIEGNIDFYIVFLFEDDICVMYPCANSGQCVPEGGSRRCVCATPYYGDECREGV